jgi:hypothetical protein
MSVDTVDYVDLGQRWVSVDGRDEARIEAVREHRWIVRHGSGEVRPWTAAELRSRYRLTET